MKDLKVKNPDELLMSVTQHVVLKKPGEGLSLKTIYPVETGVTPGWLEDNSLTPSLFFLSVYLTFINRLTGMKEISVFLNLERGRVITPFGIEFERLMSPFEFMSYLGDSLSLIKDNKTEKENDALTPGRISGEEGKVVFSFFDELADPKSMQASITDSNLGFCFSVSDGFYNLGLCYDSNSFSESQVDRWAENIKKIAGSFMKSDTKISEIDILSESEAALYKVWNNTPCPYEKDLCIHDKLIHQAKITPEKTALFFGPEIMTYHELDRYSDAFANYLIKNGVVTGDRVAVCLDRCLGMMVAVYGILKAGAAYMPLSPKFPQSRITEILDDATPRFIVVSHDSKGIFPAGSPLVDIDVFMSGKSDHDFSMPDKKVSPGEVAYIIYTSGTTGKPKGVMIEHHSVLNRIGWMQKSYPLAQNDVLIQKTPVTFDVSVWELFWWSFTGSSLVLLEPDGEKSPEILLQTIKEYGVTVIHFVPSMFSTFISYLNNTAITNQLDSLHIVFCSGEALTTTSVKDFYTVAGKIKCDADVVNLYGPTEATVDVSYFNCPKVEIHSIPIGKPIDNTQLYVVNESGRLQPFNMPGELLICGVNLARGYYNNKTLTEEKFIELDILGEKVRAYKTGDVTYWSEDGNIYYIGRNDNQIKLRGMRIEIGEIEAKILLCPSVKYCVVLLINPGTERSYLAAFYQTRESSSELNASVIKDFLKPHLPEYKIPSVFKEIKEIPLSVNGKTDRKVLLSMLSEEPQPQQSVGSSSVEKRIFEIWKRILKKDGFNLTSNFFEIGGNSLLLVQLTILLKKEFKKDVNAMVILQNPTIKMLAKHFST